jgi:hypothetical protein
MLKNAVYRRRVAPIGYTAAPALGSRVILAKAVPSFVLQASLEGRQGGEGAGARRGGGAGWGGGHALRGGPETLLDVWCAGLVGTVVSLPGTYADVCRRMPTYADVCRRC